MKYPIDTVRTRVHIQPVLHLVDFFEESTEYDRHWKLPFNSLSLCVRENPRDPSWIELPENRQKAPHHPLQQPQRRLAKPLNRPAQQRGLHPQR